MDCVVTWVTLVRGLRGPNFYVSYVSVAWVIFFLLGSKFSAWVKIFSVGLIFSAIQADLGISALIAACSDRSRHIQSD